MNLFYLGTCQLLGSITWLFFLAASSPLFFFFFPESAPECPCKKESIEKITKCVYVSASLDPRQLQLDPHSGKFYHCYKKGSGLNPSLSTYYLYVLGQIN